MVDDRGDDFLRQMQMRVADGSISPSTMRNMGPKGTIEKVRLFLRAPELLRMFAAVESKTDFERLLDEQTEQLRLVLPQGERIRNGKSYGEWPHRWGVARKCLNIFLYEVLSNRWLCEAYDGFCKLEHWLEVPLDSYVGMGLDKAGEGQTPIWESVLRLTKEQNQKYQTFASKHAADKQIARVHLDLELYNERNK